jgi:hypothetical protein
MIGPVWYLIYWVKTYGADGGCATGHVEFNSKRAAELALAEMHELDENLAGVVVCKSTQQ